MRAPHRLYLGLVPFDLMPGGWVRLACPADATGIAREHCDLGSFLAAMRARPVTASHAAVSANVNNTARVAAKGGA